VQKFAKGCRFGIQKTLHGGEAFLGAAFDHIASHGPGGAGEAENRHIRTGRSNQPPDRLHQKASFGFGIKETQFAHRFARPNRFQQMRPRIAEFQRNAHGFRGN
jgi:hypothetical protein